MTPRAALEVYLDATVRVDAGACAPSAPPAGNADFTYSLPQST
jgi:hypothetical protein